MIRLFIITRLLSTRTLRFSLHYLCAYLHEQGECIGQVVHADVDQRLIDALELQTLQLLPLPSIPTITIPSFIIITIIEYLLHDLSPSSRRRVWVVVAAAAHCPYFHAPHNVAPPYNYLLLP
jgi:hypothetical protein